MVVNLEKLLNPEYEICLCRHIKSEDVINIIENNHICSLQDLCETAHVGDKCGGCREELSALLEYVIKEKSEKVLI